METTRSTTHPLHPPRRLHRRAPRRAARGHGASWATSSTSIDDHGDHATVTFANGTTVTADLVVGADGITLAGARAAVQRQAARLRRRARLPRRHRRRRQPTAWSSTATCGCTSATARRSTSCRCSTAARCRSTSPPCAPDSTLGAAASPRRTCSRSVEGFDERIVTITRDLDMDEVNVRAVYDIDPVDTWHSDSVVLLGDAAHAMCHHQGQGANSAILDAGALADALGGGRSVTEALAPYQADPQADDRRAAAHLAPGLERGRDQRRLPRPEARRAPGREPEP